MPGLRSRNVALRIQSMEAVILIQKGFDKNWGPFWYPCSKSAPKIQDTPKCTFLNPDARRMLPQLYCFGVPTSTCKWARDLKHPPAAGLEPHAPCQAAPTECPPAPTPPAPGLGLALCGLCKAHYKALDVPGGGLFERRGFPKVSLRILNPRNGGVSFWLLLQPSTTGFPLDTNSQPRLEVPGFAS